MKPKKAEEGSQGAMAEAARKVLHKDPGKDRDWQRLLENSTRDQYSRHLSQNGYGGTNDSFLLLIEKSIAD